MSSVISLICLMLIKSLVLTLVQEELKLTISNTFSGTEPDKLNNFLFQCHFYFCANPMQFNIDITKIKFAILQNSPELV